MPSLWSWVLRKKDNQRKKENATQKLKYNQHTHERLEPVFLNERLRIDNKINGLLSSTQTGLQREYPSTPIAFGDQYQSSENRDNRYQWEFPNTPNVFVDQYHQRNFIQKQNFQYMGPTVNETNSDPSNGFHTMLLGHNPVHRSDQNSNKKYVPFHQFSHRRRLYEAQCGKDNNNLLCYVAPTYSHFSKFETSQRTPNIPQDSRELQHHDKEIKSFVQNGENNQRHYIIKEQRYSANSSQKEHNKYVPNVSEINPYDQNQYLIFQSNVRNTDSINTNDQPIFFDDDDTPFGFYHQNNYSNPQLKSRNNFLYGENEEYIKQQRERRSLLPFDEGSNLDRRSDLRRAKSAFEIAKRTDPRYQFGGITLKPNVQNGNSRLHKPTEKIRAVGRGQVISSYVPRAVILQDVSGFLLGNSLKKMSPKPPYNSTFDVSVTDVIDKKSSPKPKIIQRVALSYHDSSKRDKSGNLMPDEKYDSSEEEKKHFMSFADPSCLLVKGDDEEIKSEQESCYSSYTGSTQMDNSYHYQNSQKSFDSSGYSALANKPVEFDSHFPNCQNHSSYQFTGNTDKEKLSRSRNQDTSLTRYSFNKSYQTNPALQFNNGSSCACSEEDTSIGSSSYTKSVARNNIDHSTGNRDVYIGRGDSKIVVRECKDINSSTNNRSSTNDGSSNRNSTNHGNSIMEITENGTSNRVVDNGVAGNRGDNNDITEEEITYVLSKLDKIMDDNSERDIDRELEGIFSSSCEVLY